VFQDLTGNPRFLGPNTEESATSFVLSDGTKSNSLRKGPITMTTQVGDEMRHVNIYDVEYVPWGYTKFVVVCKFGKERISFELRLGQAIFNVQGRNAHCRSDVRWRHFGGARRTGRYLDECLVYSVVGN
jgi:hypothetical protein